MRERGWAVLDYSALTGADPVADLLALLGDAVGKHWRGRNWRALRRELTVELNATAVKVQRRVISSADSPALLARIGNRVRRRPGGRARKGLAEGRAAGMQTLRVPAGSSTFWVGHAVAGPAFGLPTMR
jgi:hypothetical protein